ncbi:type IV pilin [Methanocella sp. MCL-LM]|uniref:type IV pilin n=1 Tax=Methanocella sp. MCL-LM TaxID=3412035 RepID=UPI003C722F1D
MVKKFAKNDEGVSAVIGVILMVAITVILAAVIAAFVFSMSNGVSKPYTVGITIKKTASGDVLITNAGGPDVGQLDYVNISYQPSTSATANTSLTNQIALQTVGGSITIPAANAPTPTHVIVTGKFKDGKEQVIGETDV